MIGNETPLSNRKAREVLGFKDHYNRRDHAKTLPGASPPTLTVRLIGGNFRSGQADSVERLLSIAAVASWNGTIGSGRTGAGLNVRFLDPPAGRPTATLG
jgi:hypothetical protein